MKNFKRIISLFLTCIMLISLFAVGTVTSVSAATLTENDIIHLAPNDW